MKSKHIILIYILLMIVAISSACSKEDEKSDPIIIDQIEKNSEAENDSSNKEITPTVPLTDELTSSEVEDNSSIGVVTQPKNSGNIENNGNIENGVSLNKDIESGIVYINAVSNKKAEKMDIKNPVTTTKKIIAIDAGHQSKGNYDLEPIGPGSKTKKPKVSSGTQGKFTRVAEYKLNLVIAKKVEAELIDRGYEVYMIRETHDVNLSNKERAEMANESGADIFIRIHADGSTNSNVNGVSTLYPSKKNPYVSSLSKKSHALSDFIVDSICESTNAKNRGAIARDDMSGINWCTLPVTIIEMGYMSNKKEDKLMQTEKYQNKIVKGICDGIDSYYE
ncbi:MAG: N-acetylmuramoyl-L-alanine amidase family protein [Mobilitalea sp.]